MIAVLDARATGLLLNTLTLIASVAAVSIPVGTLLAVLVFRTALGARRLIAALLLMQTLTPLVWHAGAWQAGFGLAGWWTLQQPGFVWLDGWRGAIWIHSLAAIPAVAWIVGLGLMRVDTELEERALLAAAPSRVLRQVTLPRSLAWLAVALLWIVVSVGGEMTVTDFFQVRTFAEELYTEATVGALDTLPQSVWPLLALSIALATSAAMVVGRWMPERRELDARPPLLFPLPGISRRLANGFVIVVLVLLIAVPLGNVLWKAGVLVTSTETGRVRTWSLVKCASVIVTSPWRYRQELGGSLLLSGLTMLSTLGVSWPAAWWCRQRKRGTTLIWGAIGLLAALPGPLVGLGLIALLNQPAIPGLTWLYDRTPLAPWLAHTLRALPWTLLIAWSACRQIPDELVDRARLAGWSTISAWQRIIVPVHRGALVASAAVAWIVSWGDVAGSILVLPPGTTTLAIRVFGLLHYGVEDEVAGICAAQMLALLSVGGLTAYVQHQRQRSNA